MSEASPASLLDRLAAVRPWILLAAAGALFVALALPGLIGDSCVNDEIAHLPAAYTYWAKGDFRLNPEHPPLMKLLAGLPLQFLDVRWPEKDEFWARGEQWGFGYKLLYHAGNDADRLVFWGRLPMLLWGLLILAGLYGVTHSLFGPRGAFIALGMAAFCPELLAHSRLVNTDAPVAAWMFITVAAFWKFSRSPSWRWSVLAGLALGASLSVKYSAVMLIPALLWFLGVSFFKENPAGRPRTLPWLGQVLLIAVVSWVFIWAIYGFRYEASPDPAFQFQWKFERSADSAIAKAVALGRRHALLPEAYLYGFSFFFDHAQSRHAYAAGLHSTEGWGWYFPFAFLVKTPLPLLLLMGAGLYWMVRRWKEGDTREQFLIIPLIMYWVLAVMSRMNIGLRHVLPVVPLMIALAAGIELDRGRWKSWSHRAVLGLLLLAAVGALASAPHHLAHFNAAARLFFEPRELLVDSNLDWGQDLKRLKRYMDRHGIQSVKLGYFGNASPRQLGLRHERLPGFNMYQQTEPEWKEAEELKPGDYVAISATVYVGLLIPERNFYTSRFGPMTPVDTIGDSIILYKMPGP